MGIFKILRASEHAMLAREGRFKGSADDQRDGFIHLSYGDQVAGTLAKWFKDDAEVFLLEIDENKLKPGSLKVEESRGGALFPHLYDDLERDAVIATRHLQKTAPSDAQPAVWPDLAL